MGGGVEHVQHADAVLVGDVGEARAVARQREQLGVPRDGAAQFRELVAREIVVAQHEELGALVGIEVGRLRILAEADRAERCLAAVHRQHAQAVVREAHDARVYLVDRNALLDQQLRAVGREIGRRPCAALRHHGTALAAVEIEHPDVDIGAVALVAGVRQLGAVVRPQRIGVARLAVGEQAHLARGEVVPVQLPELRAAGIAAEDEARSRRVCQHEGDRLLEEGQLLARATGRAHAVCLRGVAEARGHQQAGTVGQPAAESRAARVRIALQPRGERIRYRGNVFGHALRAVRRRRGRGHEWCDEGDQRH
jgi:hypothetical protein